MIKHFITTEYYARRACRCYQPCLLSEMLNSYKNDPRIFVFGITLGWSFKPFALGNWYKFCKKQWKALWGRESISINPKGHLGEQYHLLLWFQLFWDCLRHLHCRGKLMKSVEANTAALHWREQVLIQSQSFSHDWCSS